MLSVGFFAFFVFSAMFNYVPFYLSGPPLHASVRVITLLYLAYRDGDRRGPARGQADQSLRYRHHPGPWLAGVRSGHRLTFIPSLAAIAASAHRHLRGVLSPCMRQRSGRSNARLTESRERANSLYVLLYYLGGAAGISAAGAAYARWGWPGVTTLGLAALVLRSPSGSRKLRRTAAMIWLCKVT